MIMPVSHRLFPACNHHAQLRLPTINMPNLPCGTVLRSSEHAYATCSSRLIEQHPTFVSAQAGRATETLGHWTEETQRHMTL